VAAFDLFLFTPDPDYARQAERAGVDGIVVDWEGIGKRDRQQGADTEINADSPEDLDRVREAVSCRVICRINQFGDQTPTELERAVQGGADEVLLPMVNDPREVQETLALAGERCGVGILIETPAAVEATADFAGLLLTRAYVGLNDLAIARGSSTIFEAVADGTVERVRSRFPGTLGWGGLTLPSAGSPIPARLLLAEMVRLRCSFSFLRRSYRADVAPHRQAEALTAIRSALAAASERNEQQIEADREALVMAIGRQLV
jgi:HpcH/HpaI aldolase/citrate lyase family